MISVYLLLDFYRKKPALTSREMLLFARKHVHAQGFVGTFSLLACSFHTLIGGKNHAHTAMTHHFGLAEDAHLCARLGEDSLKVVHLNAVGVAFHHHGT